MCPVRPPDVSLKVFGLTNRVLNWTEDRENRVFVTKGTQVTRRGDTNKGGDTNNGGRKPHSFFPADLLRRHDDSQRQGQTGDAFAL